MDKQQELIQEAIREARREELRDPYNYAEQVGNVFVATIKTLIAAVALLGGLTMGGALISISVAPINPLSGVTYTELHYLSQRLVTFLGSCTLVWCAMRNVGGYCNVFRREIQWRIDYINSAGATRDARKARDNADEATE
ncbi:hypothetical protein [Halomonas elongata]|uniref:hypothetical protein n=1 Tax=Halomonas elongata TaxID=2746 RepID=UPI0023B1818A|nr:hypothetical protein [Halomonas elongata]